MRQKIDVIYRKIVTDLWNYKEVILIFLVYYIVMHVVFHAFCPLVLLTGMPCAGCGMTRAVFFMLTGQFYRSWLLNPMALPVLLFAGYCMISRYILGRKVKGFQTGIIILCISLIISYIWRMYTVFPERAPYVFTEGSFFESYIPYYRETLRKILPIW